MSPCKVCSKGVVQFARDTCALIDTRIQPDRELPAQLKNTELIDGPQQEKKCSHARRAEPSSLIPSRSDSEIDRCSVVVP